MTIRGAILASGLAALSAAPSAAPEPETKPITELAGRIAGKPQRCMPARPGLLFDTADADPHLLLYDDGKTIWVNKLADNCGYENGETAIPDSPASYYCKGDFVRAGGRMTLLPGHRCVLGNFTPWRTSR